MTATAYLDKLASGGGIVEERIVGQELRSPSVQLNITPDGRTDVLATHDQILDGRNGQRFVGCRFPADPAYAPAIGQLARRAGEHLAATGVIGRFSIDFVVARRAGHCWAPFALEVNLRLGGTTHPYQTLAQLTDGRYDAERAAFTTPNGHPRHYVADDHLQTPGLRDVGHEGVIALARRPLRFSRARGEGTVFHMLSAVEPLGRVGVTAVAESANRATALHAKVATALARAGNQCDHPKFRPALVPSCARNSIADHPRDSPLRLRATARCLPVALAGRPCRRRPKPLP